METLGRWRAAGAERLYLQVLDLADLDHLRLVAAEVAPALSYGERRSTIQGAPGPARR